MRKTTLASLALLPFAAAPVAAQGSLHMLLGFGGDNTNQAKSVPIAGLYDHVMRDGKTDPASAELFGFLRKVFSNNRGNGAFIYDEQHIVENGNISYYIADAGDGYIVRSIDTNNNGIIEDSEATVWARFGGTSVRGPNTLSVVKIGGKTVVYVALNADRSTRPIGIYRCEDKNNDGDALDTGEVVKLLDSASALTFPGKTGTVTLGRDDWERIRSIPRLSRFFAFNDGRAGATIAPDAFCYFGFEETNGTL